MYAELAIPLAVDKLFTYRIPDELQRAVQRGVRATVPFGSRSVVGFIVDIKPSTTLGTVKNIKDVLDAEPFITEELLSLAKWIAEYYFVPLGEVLKAMALHGSVRPNRQMVVLLQNDLPGSVNTESLSKKQKEILQLLRGAKPLSVGQIEKKINRKNIHTPLIDLASRKLISIQDEAPPRFMKPKTEVIIHAESADRTGWQEWLESLGERIASKRYAKQASLIESLLRTDPSVTEFSYPETLRNADISKATLQTLVKNKILRSGRREIIRTPEIELDELSIQTRSIVLNSYQRKSLDCITGAIVNEKYQAFLLYGITGSGKTQVYIEAIKKTMEQKKTAIVLVPEISLTPQTVRRFKAHFDNQVVVMHSRMSAENEQMRGASHVTGNARL